jgi:hypothetical protein
VLAIAYHNMGIENEYLGIFRAAIDWYRRAHMFLEKHGRGQHKALVTTIRKSYADAQKVVNKSHDRDKERERATATPKTPSMWS